MTATKLKILRALKQVLVPIARVLVRSNVDCKQFIEVAKLAFVEVATDEYGIRDRKTNVSRVAILTGLIRKEVGRIRSNMYDGEEFRDIDETVSEKMLGGWHNDKQFLDKYGRPLRIEYEGSGATFAELFKYYAGDLPMGAMKKELIRTGSIRQLKNGLLKANRREPYLRRDAKRLEDALLSLSMAADELEQKVDT